MSGVSFVRYGIPALLILAGVVCLFVAPDSSAVEGWALFTGAGLSVLLLNALFRIGLSGDEEREREDYARVYFEEHGRWPDEAPTATGTSGRKWRLPEGVATPESEEAERRAAAERRESTE